MKIHPKKCEFVITSIAYFGHKILPNNIMVHWAKVIVATLALGLRPRQKGLKGAGQEECENEDSHSQVSSPLGVGVPVDSRTFKERLQRSKHLTLKSFLYH